MNNTTTVRANELKDGMKLATGETVSVLRVGRFCEVRLSQAVEACRTGADGGIIRLGTRIISRVVTMPLTLKVAILAGEVR